MPANHLFPFLLIALLLASCRRDDGALFTRLDENTTGVTFRNLLREREDFNILRYAYFYNGGGVAAGDLNNDGLPELFFSGNMVKNRLFLNKGDCRFEDVTAASHVADNQGWCTGVSMADVNADGWLDIYVCRSADGNAEKRRNLLFINNHDLTFTERAAAYGLDDDGYSTQASWLDYDGDGDLDLFLINHSLQEYTQSGSVEKIGLRQIPNPKGNKLYRNNTVGTGSPRFTDVTEAAGIHSNVLTFSLGVSTADLSGDGRPDLYVANDFNEHDNYYVNNGDGTFTDRLAACFDHVAMYAMGVDAADYNNDGLTDLVELDMLPATAYLQKMHSGADNYDKVQLLFQGGVHYQYSRNMLQKNNGDGTFSEIGLLAGIHATDWSWSPLLADFDNDGLKDLFVSNGYVKDYTDMDFLKYTSDKVSRLKQGDKDEPAADYIARMPNNERENYLFHNTGSDAFTDVSTAWGFGQKTISQGALYADLDGDGDLDLVTNNTADYAGIYRNNCERSGRHFLRLHLRGPQNNAWGYGARVTLHARGQLQCQEQAPVRGFQSSVEPVLHFGLGADPRVDSVVVTWPDGRRQVLLAPGSDQTLEVTYGQAQAALLPRHVAEDPLLERVSDFPEVWHRENAFQDFKTQGLLSRFLSRQGPGMALGDVNGDGLTDVYLGGARGQAGQLLVQQPGGSFRVRPQPAFGADSASEDTGCLLFDADGDGDADLYVVSGGYEFALQDPAAQDPALQDRFYRNDGKGNFIRDAAALPRETASGSVVRAADVDGDGDPDLFVGGRVIPGRYPEMPDSYLLVNDGKGHFEERTASLAPELGKAGMVTDACWMDQNGDGRPDLLVVGEWMAPRWFLNQGGRLVEAPVSGMPGSGWWNAVLAADFDGDGDNDLVLGNQGLNNLIRPDDRHPVSLYFGDFDQNGSVDPILCYYTAGVNSPAPSRDDLLDQLSFLRKQFTDYQSYAKAGIEAILSRPLAGRATLLQATVFHTLYLENTGQGFKIHNLPEAAQYAPTYAMASADMDGDGIPDLVLGGNDCHVRVKYGRYDASHGLVLKHDGKGNFSPVAPVRSGLHWRGEVRSLAIVPAKGSTQLLCAFNDGRLEAYRLRGKVR